MKVALIGYGYWGNILRKYIDADEAYSLVKVCSIELDKIGIYTNDINEIYNSEEIEGVFVCTPVETHFKICKMMLLSGKHVLCEKPIVKSMAELCELRELGLAKQKVLLTDYIYTFSPSINKMKESISRIGLVKRVHCEIAQFGKFYPNDNVFEVLGVHMLAAVLYILTASSVQNISFEKLVVNKTCQAGIIAVALDNKTEVEIICTAVSSKKIRTITIYGSEGLFRFDMYKKYPLEMGLFKCDKLGFKIDVEQEWEFDEFNNVKLLLDHFRQICKNKLFTSDWELSNMVTMILFK